MTAHSSSHTEHSIQFIILSLWLISNLPSLTSYPTPHPDEAWYSSNGYNLARNGNPGIPIFGDHYGLDRNNTFDGRLYLFGVGLFHLVFGIGLWQARLFSLLGGALAGWLVWQTGKRLGGAGVGALAALLFLCSWRTFYAAHRGRPEIWMAAAGAGLLWGFFLARDSRRAWAMAVFGFASASLVDIHLPVAHYFAATCLLVGIERLRGGIGWRGAGAFALGALAGIGYVVLVHLLPDPALTVLQWTHGKPGTPIVQSGYSIGAGLIGTVEWLRLGTFGYTRLGWLEVSTVVIAAGVLLWRRGWDAVVPIVYGVGVLASFAMLQANKPLYYIVLLAPSMSLIAAQAAFALPWSLAVRRAAWPSAVNWLNAVPAALAGVLVLAYLAGDAALARGNRTISFDAYSAELRKIVPAEGGLAGEGTWWFAYPDRRYTTDDYLFQGARDTSEGAKAWLKRVFIERDVRVVLQDEALSGYPRPSFGGDEAARQAAFEALLVEECQPLGEVVADFYGIDHGGMTKRRTVVWDCQSFDKVPQH